LPAAKGGRWGKGKRIGSIARKEREGGVQLQKKLGGKFDVTSWLKRFTRAAFILIRGNYKVTAKMLVGFVERRETRK